MMRRYRQDVRLAGGKTATMRRRFLLASLVAMALAAFVAAAPASAGTLDQQQTSSDADKTLLSNQSVGQTFTAGISGGLDQVDLDLWKVGTPPPSVTVEIRNASAGQPGTGVLATASIPTSAIGTTHAFVPATFATSAPVTAGTQYAIVVYSPGAMGNAVLTRYQNASNPYPGGFMSISFTSLPPGATWSERRDDDLAFKTYVVPSVNELTATCKGQQTTQIGTAGNDELEGTPERDIINGLGGKDEISGLAGKDLICGGAGRDTLRGGKGKDKLYGQKGKDRLSGGGGKDRCVGGKKDDTAKKCEVEKSV